MPSHSHYRRQFLGAAGVVAMSRWVGSALAAKPPSEGSPYVIAQVVDMSMAQQDVSKDILIGCRAAWQEINAGGGVQGRNVLHTTYEVDGTPQSVRDAVTTMSKEQRCIAISATAGERTALELTLQLQKANLSMAHVAPWLQDSTLKVDEQTFPIFATRQEQIAFALKTLTKQGVSEFAAIYEIGRAHV